MYEYMEVFFLRDYKPYIAIAITALLASFTFSACTPITTIDQATDSASKGNSPSTEASGHPNPITPAFFSEMGKTLGELREEYPEGITVVSLDGFPDCAAICFGDPESEYLYYFFGTQSGDAEKAMNEYEDELKCAGFLATAGILFPEMDEDMPFEEFFALIGVEDYEYFGKDVITAEGWYFAPPFGTPATVIFCRFLRSVGKQKIPIPFGNQDFTVFFSSKWCHQESNRGHKDFQSFALPTELWHRCFV